MRTTNVLARYTPGELEAGLSLLYEPSAAKSIAEAVYTIPANEAVFYDWIETTLILMACASEHVERRVRDVPGSDDEVDAFHARLDEIKRWIAHRPHDKSACLQITDVIYDSRRDGGEALE